MNSSEMSKYASLLEKYGCSLKEGKIFNSKGNDTKIIWDSFVQLQENLKLIKASNEAQVMNDLLNSFEEELKLRSEL